MPIKTVESLSHQSHHSYHSEKYKTKIQPKQNQKEEKNKFWGESRKQGPSLAILGNINLSSHYVSHCGVSSEQWKFELSYDPSLWLLGIYFMDSKSAYSKDMDFCNATSRLHQRNGSILVVHE